MNQSGPDENSNRVVLEQYVELQAENKRLQIALIK
jgi:hypothetical protein